MRTEELKMILIIKIMREYVDFSMKKHNTAYNPANYEFSLYCTKCMCRISEDGPVGRCCLFPIKDKFIRKLYYKHNRHNRNDYYTAALAMGKREIAKEYRKLYRLRTFSWKC